ncbi:hypothetical protein, conserved [Trypanosoma brucei gambiense DAL972]|uniref:Mon2 C-terminal domain-containing protein n=1 Tax=Trypanosoma brucei gambiense (strain MHOM/CI/86/DAL972) TaxID=679716 RepID=D0A9C4_TRYB9|nr:hypothetical protein, conserved [Trypanosoma brucei gambiense DAL972]CBH18275.1 hypothetical protein, conserved [Trypanosoma brucei gambiense DAL972]|eukprot:XP_011780539.1 hypothetical protein, conserved [Trypanosoma brucei gambiense DAL972]
MSSGRNTSEDTDGAAPRKRILSSSSPPSSSTLVVVVFQSSLEELMLEATRHRSLVPLRDAIHYARMNGHAAGDIFHAFVLACDSLHGMRQSRPLLLRSLKDLAKMASLQMIPITPTVLQVICNLVRKMLGSALPNTNTAVATSQGPHSASKDNLQHGVDSATATSSARHRNASEVRVGAAATDFERLGSTKYGASNSSFHGGEVAGDLVPSPAADDELQISILQMLMSFLSVCELSNAGLADLMGVIFTMYIQSTPASVVEASCAATIEQRTIAVLEKLQNIGGGDPIRGSGDDNISAGSSAVPLQKTKLDVTDTKERDDLFTARIQMVAYVKDICALCADTAPKWLKIGMHCSNSVGQDTEGGVSDASWAVAPWRLRVLLLETLIKYFETHKVTSSRDVTIFFVQCLNQDIVPLVLRRMDSCDGCSASPQMPGQKDDGIVELIPVTDDDEHQLILTQKLSVTLLSNALPLLQNTMHAILRHNVSCVARCLGDVDRKVENHCALSLLSLWRKQVSNYKVLQQLLLIAPESNRSFTVVNEDSSSQQESHKFWHDVHFNPDSGCVRYGSTTLSDGMEPSRSSSLQSQGPGYPPFGDSEKLLQPFAELVAAASRLLTRMITAVEDGVLESVRVDPLPEGSKSVGELLPSPVTTASFLKSHFRAVLRSQRLLQQRVFGNAQEGENSDHGAPKVPPATTATDARPSHPKVTGARDILDFLAIFTQTLAHIVEVLTREKDSVPLGEMKSTFISLHPFLFRSFTLSAQKMRRGGVIYTVMRGITNMVYISCFLRLPEIRNSYLGVFRKLLSQERGQEEVSGVVRRQQEDAERHAPSTQGFGSDADTVAKLVDCSLEVLEEKQYILNCVVSIAFNIGGGLGDGWCGVVSCLLFTPQVLHDLQKTIQRQQHANVPAKEGVSRDTAHDVEYLQDALRALFVNCALSPSGESLLNLLANFVKEACNSLPLGAEGCEGNIGVSTSYLSSLQLICECCSLALLVGAGRSDELPPKLFLQLWRPVRVLYQRLFSPQHLMLLVKASATVEELKSVLGDILENVVVVAAQLCRYTHCDGKAEYYLIHRKCGADAVLGGELLVQPLTLGPFANTGLVTLLSRLSSLLGQPQLAFPEDSESFSNINSHCVSTEGNSADDDTRPRVLSSVTELLDTIYSSLRKLPFVAPAVISTVGVGGGTNTACDDVDVLNTLSGDLSLLLLKEVFKLIQGFGEDLCGLPWEHLLRLLRRSVTMHDPVELMSSLSSSEARALAGLTEATSVKSFHVPTGVKQGIGVAFRTLETVQHSHITSLNGAGLRELIRCGGAFMTHRLPQGEEQRLNINLSAVQLLWSIADYSASLGHLQDGEADDNGGNASTSDSQYGGVTYDLLWCTLLLQLYDGCLDLRPEVRQSALKTLFSLVQAHSNRLYADSWRTFLREVLGPLMDVVLEAAKSCAAAPDFSAAPSVPLQGASEPDDTAHLPKSNRQNSEGHRVTQLLKHFNDTPTFLDDVRVTIMDSVYRVFISHHSAMHKALVTQAKVEKQRVDGELLLRKTLSHFIDVCAASRLVSRSTSGEVVALSATRALHGLMASLKSSTLAPDQVPLLLREEREAAWSAVEGLIHRDSESLHTANAQCTPAVVSTIVSALGDIVVLQRSNASQPTTPGSSGQQEEAPVFASSLFGALRQSFANEPRSEESKVDSYDYFPRYLQLSEVCLRSHAVTEAYFFPSRVQVALLDVWKRLWIFLGAEERGAVVSVVMRQFPTEEIVITFVGQKLRTSQTKRSNVLGGGAGLDDLLGQQEPISLRRTFPPGAHPNFLMDLMGFLYFITNDEDSAKQTERCQSSGSVKDSLITPMIPAIIRGVGVLLLLEYASPDVLATPCRGLLYHIPSEFFNRAEKCLEMLLVDVLWNVDKQDSSATAITTEGAESTLHISRREGLLAFCSCFASLTSLARVMAAAVETGASSTTEGKYPENLVNALQRLERLVSLLGKLIPYVMRYSTDVSVVTDALQVLVPVSSAESSLFAGVARRSLCLLRQWSLSSPSGGPSCEREKQKGIPQELEKKEVGTGELQSVEEGELTDKRLQSMARASMGARNRAVFRRFLHDIGNEEARQMAKTSLQTIALIHPVPEGIEKAVEESDKGSAVSKPYPQGASDATPTDCDRGESDTTSLKRTLLQMVRLVAHTGDDPEFSALLSNAILGVCSSLGLTELS